MKTKNLLAMLSVAVLFVSCWTQVPIQNTKPVNNETYEVSYLFEHDGCKVYRFKDGSNYVYFTNCNGNVTSIKNDSTATRVITITNRQINP